MIQSMNSLTNNKKLAKINRKNYKNNRISPIN